MSDQIIHDHNHDGIDRRGFLKCMAWAGTGALLAVSGGILRSQTLTRAGDLQKHVTPGDLSFVQISDSHIGFSKEANKDVLSTLQAAIDKINALPTPPAFILHTGDLSHLSKPEEFDALDQLLKSVRTEKIFYVPGEHDVLTDNGAIYLERYGKGTKGAGWQSFDVQGVHFIGLVNVLNLKDLSSSTPIVVFAHIPLWTVYPEWGWGTDDSEQALSYLKRFGSVTVLNGHIHQTLQKIEGNVHFHTAMSTAFPQPAPGMAASPGPMKVPAEKLRSVLGLTSVNYIQSRQALAIIDSSLDSAAAASTNA